jgi:hypothetical protein
MQTGLSRVLKIRRGTRESEPYHTERVHGPFSFRYRIGAGCCCEFQECSCDLLATRSIKPLNVVLLSRLCPSGVNCQTIVHFHLR